MQNSIGTTSAALSSARSLRRTLERHATTRTPKSVVQARHKPIDGATVRLKARWRCGVSRLSRQLSCSRDLAAAETLTPGQTRTGRSGSAASIKSGLLCHAVRRRLRTRRASQHAFRQRAIRTRIRGHSRQKGFQVDAVPLLANSARVTQSTSPAERSSGRPDNRRLKSNGAYDVHRVLGPQIGKLTAHQSGYSASPPRK
jgi:hypothetical protein